ncbi:MULTISPECIES: DUF1254 domain-containing protein [unclassified Bradyrhizobium]|uniref:DUF1254 domain-containing protein n=1 Tax=unclassified Bradyrhizobium TaxID=2631580 RepID=UPI001BA71796|nr:MULTISPECIES: DUF1254 domain-containing protein [unclassified Bradyrhizobium]MBR1224587.1 DUF1254 domain-containing protein [Bradyrhizobium sp. AUGA SZCCT0176]MBR1295887.1 DUF1254 domain-containing protein [Bradyrhizobium sp. AUGA SZCCT0042]
MITNANPDRRNILLTGTTLAIASVLAGSTSSGANAESSSLNPQPLPPSPGWARALPSGPDARVKITEAYAAHVARDAFFWAWPLVNIYNRRLAFSKMTEQRYVGPLLEAPLNRLTMLTDYVDPEERNVACPNQDVVYGLGMIALDVSPVVVQVPDFGDRFWVYQIVDLRTDSFVQLGKMYGTVPGFYLLVGPNWSGEVPKGITRVFRASSNTGLVAPRVFQDDTPQDKRTIQGVLTGIAMYPLADYDGRMKSTEWSKLPKVAGASPGEEETRWVLPEKFFDELPIVIADAPPLPGEEARYAQLLAVLAAAKDNPKIKQAMIEAAKDAEEKLVNPLFQFRNYGQQLPHNWSTISNESAFGTDYFTRTAVAKSNILVNSPNETKYFYQDLDASGARLNNSNRYAVTFAKDGTPPVNGFWSLSIYNQHHFFVANPINRFSVGTKNKDLKPAADGSLTIYVQADAPADPTQRANWLPAPKGDFSLYVRAYWPKAPVLDVSWTPPPVQRVS